jgi:hypothetical protein
MIRMIDGLNSRAMALTSRDLDSPNVAATYAGFSNTMYEGLTVTGPTLILDLGF